MPSCHATLENGNTLARKSTLLRKSGNVVDQLDEILRLLLLLATGDADVPEAPSHVTRSFVSRDVLTTHTHKRK